MCNHDTSSATRSVVGRATSTYYITCAFNLQDPKSRGFFDESVGKGLKYPTKEVAFVFVAFAVSLLLSLQPAPSLPKSHPTTLVSNTRLCII